MHHNGWQDRSGIAVRIAVIGVVMLLEEGQAWLQGIVLSCFAKGGSGGNIAVIIKLLTYHSDKKDAIIMLHPFERGFILFER